MPHAKLEKEKQLQMGNIPEAKGDSREVTGRTLEHEKTETMNEIQTDPGRNPQLERRHSETDLTGVKV